MLLQPVEQCGLHIARETFDVVQDQRAAGRRRQQAAVAVGAKEGDGGREGPAAVEEQARRVVPVAARVQRAGEPGLADSRIADDQHAGGARASEPAQRLPHAGRLGARAHDRQLGRPHRRFHDGTAGEGGTTGREQHVGVERLAQVVVGAPPHRFHDAAQLHAGGHDERR